MRLSGRVSRLEQGVEPGECRCSPPRVVYEPAELAPAERSVEPEVCVRCGRRRTVLTVRYVDNWRVGDANG